MKKYYLLFTILFCTHLIHAQLTSVNWNKSIFPSNTLAIDNRVQFDSNNNGYVLNGENHLEKFDFRNGNNINSFTFTANFPIQIKKFHVYPDGSLLIFGEEEDSTGDKGIFLAKYTSQFNLSWKASHRGTSGRPDLAVDLELSDSAIYICGVKDLGTINQNSLVWLAKYTPSGSLLWETTHSGLRNRLDLVNDMVINYLGEIFITGATTDYVDQFGGEAIKRFLTKYDQSGNRVWNKKSATHYAGMGPPPFFTGINHNDDEGYLLAVDSQHVYLAEHLYEGGVPFSDPYFQGNFDDAYGAKISIYNFGGGVSAATSYQQSGSASYKRMFGKLVAEGGNFYYTVSTNGIQTFNNDFVFYKRDQNNNLIYSKNYSSDFWVDFEIKDETLYLTRALISLTPSPISLNLSQLDSAGNTLWNFHSSGINDNPFVFQDNNHEPYLRTESRFIRKICKALPQLNILTADTSICPGDTIQLNATAGGDYSYWNTSIGLSDSTILNPFASPFSSRTYYLNTVFTNGCKTKALVRVRSTGNEQNFNICSSDSLVYNNKVYRQSGTYFDTLSLSGTCDSIIQINLQVQNIQSNLSASICSNDSLFFNNSYLKTAGVYHDTLSSNQGCDSIIQLSLAVNPAGRDTSLAAACEKYYWALTGDTLFSSGLYSDTLQTGACDSIVTLDLHIYQPTQQYDTVQACNSYYWSANQTLYTQTGIYSATLQSQQSCDSIITLDLTIDQVNNQMQQQGDSLVATQNNAKYQWFECSNGYTLLPSDTLQVFHPSQNGNYAVEIQKGACIDTSNCLNVILTGIANQDANNSVRVYPNPVNDRLTIEGNQKESRFVTIFDRKGSVVYQALLPNSTQVLDLSTLPAGLYLLKVNEKAIRLVKN